MANTSSYTFAKHTPTYKIQGYQKGKDGLLVMDTVLVQGLQLFGHNGGVLTEDNLTDELVEYILSDKYKSEITGKNIFAEFLIKKGKNDNKEK